MLSVIYSMLELISYNYTSSLELFFGEKFLKYFRFLRILLVLRILKFCRKLEYMRFIFKVIKDSFKNFTILLCLFFLIISFYGLIGRQIFNEIFLAKNPKNTNFQTFGDSCITVFTLITLDNWYNTIVLGTLDVSNFIYLIVYVVSLIFIGNFIFLNMFLTVLLDTFENELFKKNKKAIEENDEKDDDEDFLKKKNSLVGSNYDNEMIKIICRKIIKSKIYASIYYFFIVLNTFFYLITSFFKDSTSPDDVNSVIDKLKIVLYSFYTFEAIVTIIANGLYFNPNAYLKNYSNKINLIALTGFYFKCFYRKSESLGYFVASIFEMLVPLRIFRENKNLKHLLDAILKSLDQIFNVVITLLIVWLELKYSYLYKKLK